MHFIKAVISEDSKVVSDQSIPTWIFRIAVLMTLSFLIALMGPFGTYFVGSLGERFFYWAVLIFVSVITAFWIRSSVTEYFSQMPYFLREAAIILAMTALFTPFLQYWTVQAYPGGVRDAPSLWLLGCQVLAICTALSAIVHVIPVLVMRSIDTMPQPLQPRLTCSLPEGFSGEIFRLTVEGHKVQVFTSVDMFELRMRFADAVGEVSELDGFCVHRSHWVARAWIKDVLMRNGRPVLLMENGDQVPVSRKYQDNLSRAGLL